MTIETKDRKFILVEVAPREDAPEIAASIEEFLDHAGVLRVVLDITDAHVQACCAEMMGEEHLPDWDDA